VALGCLAYGCLAYGCFLKRVDGEDFCKYHLGITDVKIVGECSKHGGQMKDKNGNLWEDKDIACIICAFEGLTK
jgi:hypothetical protein